MITPLGFGRRIVEFVTELSNIQILYPFFKIEKSYMSFLYGFFLYE
jgi:hypothetical protein